MNGVKTHQVSNADFIRGALQERGLTDADHSRSSYQRNDYIVSLCVTHAKWASTEQKRLDQKFDELESGDIYMNMK